MVIVVLTKAQGTFPGLHGYPNGPLNGPWKADFQVPLVKKILQGPFWVQIGQFIHFDHWTLEKLKYTAWFGVNPAYGPRDTAFLILCGQNCTPSPRVPLSDEGFEHIY